MSTLGCDLLRIIILFSLKKGPSFFKNWDECLNFIAEQLAHNWAHAFLPLILCRAYICHSSSPPACILNFSKMPQKCF